MRCLVLMPFHSDFDAVYDRVRAAVNAAPGGATVECYWLKDVRAAGRITDDILRGIQDATLCVADLTDNNPNVMWETGYAMALGRPTILIGQSVETIPFDLRTHRILPYQRDRLDALSVTLSEAVRQTLARYTVSRLGDRPGNVYWLGHDLARAIRLGMFEPDSRVELTGNLLGALHHLDQVRLSAPDARRLLLDALGLARSAAAPTDEQRRRLVIDVARAKNELGQRIAQVQADFQGYPTLEEVGRLEAEADATRS